LHTGTIYIHFSKFLTIQAAKTKREVSVQCYAPQHRYSKHTNCKHGKWKDGKSSDPVWRSAHFYHLWLQLPVGRQLRSQLQKGVKERDSQRLQLFLIMGLFTQRPSHVRVPIGSNQRQLGPRHQHVLCTLGPEGSQKPVTIWMGV